MAEHYTDEDVRVGAARIDYAREEWFDDCGPESLDVWYARAVLDAVAPAIAARALREAARQMQNGIGEAYDPSRVDYEQQRHEAQARRAWLFTRADEIEGR